MLDCRMIGYAAQRVATVGRMQSPVRGKLPAGPGAVAAVE
jgi:hypothetical protein